MKFFSRYREPTIWDHAYAISRQIKDNYPVEENTGPNDFDVRATIMSRLREELYGRKNFHSHDFHAMARMSVKEIVMYLEMQEKQ